MEGRKTGRTWFGKYHPQQEAGLEKSGCSQVPKSWSKALFPHLISIMLAGLQKNSEISVSYYDVNLFFNHIKLDCYSGMQANKNPDTSQVSTSKAALGTAMQPLDPGDESLGYHMESTLAGVGSAICHFHPALLTWLLLSVRRQQTQSLAGQPPLNNNSELRKESGTLCHFPSFAMFGNHLDN